MVVTKLSFTPWIAEDSVFNTVHPPKRRETTIIQASPADLPLNLGRGFGCYSICRAFSSLSSSAVRPSASGPGLPELFSNAGAAQIVSTVARIA